MNKIIEASGMTADYVASIPKYLTEAEALEAVKQNGYTLQYVKEQSEEICLEAVKANGDALKYVDIEKFNKKSEEK
jgi:hypothetical protein